MLGTELVRLAVVEGDDALDRIAAAGDQVFGDLASGSLRHAAPQLRIRVEPVALELVEMWRVLAGGSRAAVTVWQDISRQHPWQGTLVTDAGFEAVEIEKGSFTARIPAPAPPIPPHATRP